MSYCFMFRNVNLKAMSKQQRRQMLRNILNGPLENMMSFMTMMDMTVADEMVANGAMTAKRREEVRIGMEADNAAMLTQINARKAERAGRGRQPRPRPRGRNSRVRTAPASAEGQTTGGTLAQVLQGPSQWMGKARKWADRKAARANRKGNRGDANEDEAK